MNRMLFLFLAAAALTACQGEPGKDGADGAIGEQGVQGEQGVAGQDGAPGNDLAAPEAAIAAVAPNALLAGRTTTINVVGYFTEWDGSTAVTFADAEGNAIEGVTAETTVVSPVGLKVAVTVAAEVALGNLQMTIATGDQELVYAPAGAEVVVAATASADPGSLAAGEVYSLLIETAEFMASPTIDAENCVGLNITEASRYSQNKFSVAGWVHPAASTGTCTIRLVQDPETDDEWVSALNIDITAPNAVTFAEGVASGEITPNAPMRTVSVPVEAGRIVSLRHSVNEDAGLDGTGPEFSVFVEGNLEPIYTHDGGSHWLEIPNIEARELLIAFAEELDEGNDPVPFSLTTIVPHGEFTALENGATQNQQLPANDQEVNEAGRASWYTITNDAAYWTSLSVAADNAETLQSHFEIMAGDEVIQMGSDGWEGVLEAGTFALRVVDTEQDAEDGLLTFAIELNRLAMLSLDEQGNASGNLQTGTAAVVLVPVAAGLVNHLSATRAGDGDQPAIEAIWQDAEEAVAAAVGTVDVPSANEGNLILRITLEGDLGENGVDFTFSHSTTEPTALNWEGTEGSAPENGGAWFTANARGGVQLTVTPGNAEQLQTSIQLYGAMGAELAAVSANELEGEALGTIFIKVADGEFVAEQDQTFTIAGATFDLAIAECLDEPALDLTPNEEMTWSHTSNFENAVNMVHPGGWRPSNYNVVRHILNVSEPVLLDTYIESDFDSRLAVLHACAVDSWSGEGVVAHNDDGRDWHGNFSTDGALNNVALEPGQYIVGVTTFSSGHGGGDFTLHYRLRSPE